MKYGVDKEAAEITRMILIEKGILKPPYSPLPPPLEVTMPSSLIIWPKRK